MDGQLGQGVKPFRITRRRKDGFGIALSGGASPIGGHVVDNSIYISDVVAGGPADAQCLKMEKPPVTPYITENLPFMTKK